MYLLIKLKRHGLVWFLRRVYRELIAPTTAVGKRLKVFSFIIYSLINKPTNFLFSLFSPQNHPKDTLYFFYDFEVEPITYDFVWAMCIANAYREELKFSQLHIVFVPGTIQGLRQEELEYEQTVSQDARNWRIHAMLLPSIKLLSCPTSVTFCATRAEALKIRNEQAQFVYPAQYTVPLPIPYSPKQAMDYGQKMLALKADPQAIKYVSQWLSQKEKNKKLVVITLRQYDYSPARNSNIIAWAKFANTLDKELYWVVFVPDTEAALSEIPKELKGFDFFDAACWNLNLRCALYELAYINLGVNNGPMALCWLNAHCRYLMFKTFIEGVPQAAIETLIERGFVPNQNPLFANEFQKWVWDNDDYEVIYQEFNLMCDVIDKGVVGDRITAQ